MEELLGVCVCGGVFLHPGRGGQTNPPRLLPQPFPDLCSDSACLPPPGAGLRAQPRSFALFKKTGLFSRSLSLVLCQLASIKTINKPF